MKNISDSFRISMKIELKSKAKVAEVLLESGDSTSTTRYLSLRIYFKSPLNFKSGGSKDG
jgi:hypothetical protein